MPSNGYYALELPQMDSVHQEFVALLSTLQSTSNENFLALFQEIIHHTQIHFGQEEDWLEHYHVGSSKEHKDEHAKILNEMDYFLEKVKKGRLQFAKAYVRERLPEWLYQHTISMDADLAKAIKSV